MKTDSRGYAEIAGTWLHNRSRAIIVLLLVWALTGVYVNLSGIIHVYWTSTPLFSWYVQQGYAVVYAVGWWMWALNLGFYVVLSTAAVHTLWTTTDTREHDEGSP